MRGLIVLAVTDEVDFSAWPPPPDPWGATTATQWPVPPRRRRPWRIVYWVTLGLLCAAVAGLVVGFYMTFGAIRIISSGMAPTLPAGSVAYYQRGAGGVVRGDLVVINSPSGLLVRRVIGLPGDRVMCCNSDGWMEVDGQTLMEDYLPFSYTSTPSKEPFSATVGTGQVWVMGDNRAVAVDSRSFGPLPMTDIVGRIFQVRGSGDQASGPGGWVILKTPETFIATGLAPADHRVALPLVLIGGALFALLAVIVQGTLGTIRWAVLRGRRKRLRQPPLPPLPPPLPPTTG